MILNSYHHGFAWTDEIVTTIQKSLANKFGKIEFYIEYMDHKRIVDPDLEVVYSRVLEIKYRNQGIDLVIVSDDYALRFLKKVHHRIFRQVPVVFCGINSLENALSVDRDFFTGVVESLDISSNIALVLQLFPGTGSIAIVSDGTPTGIGTREMAREAAGKFTNISFIYLNGEELNTGEMLAELKRLPVNSAVIAPAWYQDKEGNTFNNQEIYPQISEAADVPVFGTSSANLGLGIIGGKVNGGEIQGRYAANLAARILTGAVSPKDIPVETEGQNRYMFDYRQLQRFDIPEDRLPKNSQILFQPFSFYQTYRYLVWGVGIVFCLFVLMIMLLLVAIQHLRRTKNSLAASEENLRVTLQSIGDAVISTDISGKITRINRLAETLTEWPENDAVGRHLEEVVCLISAKDQSRISSPLKACLIDGRTKGFDYGTILVSKYSKEYRVEDSCSAITDDAGTVVGAVLVFRDITAEYEREVWLQQSQKMEVVGQLAGGVAHDFNNMLSGIIGAAELIARDLPGRTRIHKYLDIILESSGRAAGLTKKLLTFAGKKTPTSTVIDVHKALEETIALLENTLDRRILLDLSLDAEHTTVVGDASQLQSAFLNLTINASHAMSEGGTIMISTDNIFLDSSFCEASTFSIEPGDFVKVTVRDTGTGIKPEIIPRIFEPFFTTKEPGKGTGLGLAAVFGVVQQHNGAISVRSELGAGSSFEILLPLTDRASDTDFLITETISGRGKILVVDDEEIMRITAKAILEGLGYEVDVASSGHEGLALIEQSPHSFDLVILDMIMPGMTGRDCFIKMKTIAPEIPVILSSGFSKEEDVQDMKDEGLSYFISKPFYTAALSKAVHEALRAIS